MESAKSSRKRGVEKSGRDIVSFIFPKEVGEYHLPFIDQSKGLLASKCAYFQTWFDEDKCDDSMEIEITEFSYRSFACFISFLEFGQICFRDIFSYENYRDHYHYDHSLLEMDSNNLETKQFHKAFLIWEHGKDLKDYSITCCDPLEMYGLADYFGSSCLRELALKAIQSHLSPTSAYEVLFHPISLVYEEVSCQIMQYIIFNWDIVPPARLTNLYENLLPHWIKLEPLEKKELVFQQNLKFVHYLFTTIRPQIYFESPFSQNFVVSTTPPLDPTMTMETDGFEFEDKTNSQRVSKIQKEGGGGDGEDDVIWIDVQVKEEEEDDDQEFISKIPGAYIIMTSDTDSESTGSDEDVKLDWDLNDWYTRLCKLVMGHHVLRNENHIIPY